MILRISSIALVIAAINPMSSLAFQTGQIIHPAATASRRPRGLASPRMSSISDDDGGEDNNNSNSGLSSRNKNNLSLPPAPEDPIALGGDVVALFVYSYLDHFVNEIYAGAVAEADNVADLVGAVSEAVAEGGASSLPVWFDPANLQTFGHNWLAVQTVEMPYAPAIASGGLAFVALATSWIVCGYFSGAFLSANTLECDTSRAMVVTLRTWAGTCLLMVLLALGSDALWGRLDDINALSAPARGGLTKADADFIFDSLTVLAFWRFMFNWLLGYRK